ncbi:protein of unknown function [Chitinophaga eiseniae]|uniref:eCIS core domain-containing protein n=1 Tax=Chitinophaga eiseniae TaxID=634771 RepID=A0A1T4T848_9BACT|nr:DUF4157 domain-containing protein [Chitinophaga eiseniae]SKA36529.1 protein of unknown function [Chitinophaga eiseniae]
MKAGADAAPKTSAAQKAPKSAPSLKNEEKPFFAPAMPPVQTKLKVGSPNDPSEKEADSMADKVMRMPAATTAAKIPAGKKIQTKKEDGKLQAKHKDPKKVQAKAQEGQKVQAKPEEKVQKKEEQKIQKKGEQVQKKEEQQVQKKEEQQVQKKEDTTVQRKGEGTPITVTNEIGEGIRQQSAGGFTLSDDTRSFMESRFNADFSNVRIHTGPESAQLNNQLGAKAFTYQNHIFFNNNQYQPEAPAGKQLLAHELTHTIQQGQSVQRSAAAQPAGPMATAMAPQIQRFLGIDIPSWQDVLDWLAEKAYHIPGYRMFTIVIGVNPINGESADRSAANILRAIVEFLPGGHLITEALDKYNVFEKAGSWVEQQLKRFSGLMGEVKSAVSQFMDDLDFLDIILHPVRTWERAVAIFTKPVNDIIDFIKSIFQAIMQFIRDAVLKPLGELAAKAPGFDLLCAVLGTNPITGETVPRNADTLIGGFMKMIGRQDIWDNIKKGNAIQKAFAWFQNAMKGLVTLVTSFPAQFIAMLKSLEVMDFIILPNLFKKVFGVFGSFATAFFNWALNTIFDLLEIIFSVVAPGAMPYLAKARSAFRSILEKPMVFVRHLMNAVKKGFNQFKDRIGTWFKKAIVGWLLGSLEGANIYIPQSFAPKELLKLGLSVFGLTWQNLRVKLVKALGETAVAALETGFDILKTLVTEGPAAAWDKIQDKIEELKAQFFQEVTMYVTVTVVQKAITKLLSSLNPVGAFIQAIIAIYDTIMFVIQKIRQIAQVGLAVVNSIVEIASGNIGKAANAVENVLGGLLKLAISFLANFLGLGKIADKIVAIIKKLRAPVDKAMDKLVDWLVTNGKKLLGKIAQTGVPKDPEERLKVGLQKAQAAANRFAGKKVGKLVLDPLFAAIKVRYGFQSLEAIRQGNKWSIKGVVNPWKVVGTDVEYVDAAVPTDDAVKLDPFPLTFAMQVQTAKTQFDRSALILAVSHHQDYLNSLTVERWINNIDSFKSFTVKEKRTYRDTYREHDLKKKAEAILKDAKSKGIAMKEEDALAIAQAQQSGTHASHSADFILGGDVNVFHSMEVGKYNSYVGSVGSRHRATLEGYSVTLKGKIPKEKQSKIYMNFRFNTVIT